MAKLAIVEKTKIRIIRGLLCGPKCKFIESEDGKLSYMGQILKQHSPHIRLLPKAGPVRLVSDYKENIPPFTRYCQDKIVQTDLATNILNLPCTPTNEPKLVELLSPYFDVVFE